ncbi:MAG: DUF4129 domain-containing protein, partial [Phycisphaerae bacterium]|nr:DUF4129 domain-containing protein [Phycisphaerae bacterium]
AKAVGHPSRDPSRNMSSYSRTDALSPYHQRARGTVSEVLSRREFADLTKEHSWWPDFVKWVGGLFEGIGEVLRSLPLGLLWVIVVLMVLTLLAILGHAVYVLYGLLGARSVRRASRRGKELAGEVLGISDLDFDSVYQQARRHLAEGDWLAATRHLYVAAILLLDRRGWVAFRGCKTNRDYLLELAGRPACQTGFRRLTGSFESVVYGNASPSDTSCQEMISFVEGLGDEANLPGPC